MRGIKIEGGGGSGGTITVLLLYSESESESLTERLVREVASFAKDSSREGISTSESGDSSLGGEVVWTFQ